jgi:hypothetical protein
MRVLYASLYHRLIRELQSLILAGTNRLMVTSRIENSLSTSGDLRADSGMCFRGGIVTYAIIRD